MYVPCLTCGRRATARVIQRSADDVHLCDSCLRGTVPQASALPVPNTLCDRFLAACEAIRAEELRGPTLAEIDGILCALTHPA
jgi:hypothetical protein